MQLGQLSIDLKSIHDIIQLQSYAYIAGVVSPCPGVASWPWSQAWVAGSTDTVHDSGW